MARTPLFFWAGEWNTWPVSLSLSIIINIIFLFLKISNFPVFYNIDVPFKSFYMFFYFLFSFSFISFKK